MAVPTVAECRDRLKLTEDRIGDEELADVLAGEIELQAKVCAIPEPDVDPDVDTFPVSLRNALFRRVARALSIKANLTGVQVGDAGVTYLPSNDPEVRRLERPFRLEVFA